MLFPRDSDQGEARDFIVLGRPDGAMIVAFGVIKKKEFPFEATEKPKS